MHRKIIYNLKHFRSASLRVKASLLLAMLHLSAFVGFDLYYVLNIHGEAQDILVWFWWIAIDFPISLLQFLALMLNSMINGGYITFNILLILVHGWLGTLWWYYFPLKLWGWIAQNSETNERVEKGSSRGGPR